MKQLIKILLFSFCLLITSLYHPNLLFGLDWEMTWGMLSSDEWACSVQQTSDDGFIICGYTNSSGAGGYDFLLLKTNKIGDVQWYRTYGSNYNEFGYYAEQTTDGGYIMTGNVYIAGMGNQVWLIKTDERGNLEWDHNFGGPNDDVGHCVHQTIDGGYIVVGKYLSTTSQVYLIKANAEGGLEWEFTNDGTYENEAWSVQQTHPDNGYITVGSQRNPQGNTDLYVIKVLSNGQFAWENTYGGADYDVGCSVVQTDEGGFVFLGYTYSYGAGAVDYYLVKTDEAGQNPIERTYGGPANDWGRCIVRDISGYALAGYTASYGSGAYDYWLVKTDINGNEQWNITAGSSVNDDCVSSVFISEGSYIMAGSTQPSGGGGWWDVYLAKTFPPDKIYTLDSLSLAYNGNRHLVRKEGTTELHLVYTSSERIHYCKSSDGGTTWGNFKILGRGKWPCIVLSANSLPSVVWTDAIGGLWYRYQQFPNEWSPSYHLYDPWQPFQSILISPPSISIVSVPTGEEVHILVARAEKFSANGHLHHVSDFSFRLGYPENGSFEVIEYGGTIAQPLQRISPSITKDAANRLHAVWLRTDTICYAVKEIGQPWNIWGHQFGNDGLQSTHPFVETYGDSVFVVWQRIEPSTMQEEVYRAARYITEAFGWAKLSLTDDTPSLLP